jgi:hypothetical protein
MKHEIGYYHGLLEQKEKVYALKQARYEEVVAAIDALRFLHREGKLKKPKGLFIKKCPMCKKKLTKSFLYDWGRKEYCLYECPSCDYEFGEYYPQLIGW